jgi:hypothetical protein
MTRGAYLAAMTPPLSPSALGALVFVVSAGATCAEDAQQAPTVLELYTSQGCSSCPAADAVLGEMVKSGKVIGLTFSVDYWDYLGWRDTLGNPQHAERQRGYAKAAGGGQVYTPQLVVNGMKQVVGSNRAAIKAAIEKSATQIEPRQIAVEMREEDGALLIEEKEKSEASALVKTAGQKAATIWLALVRRHVTVRVETGENRGRLLHYVNAVRAFTPIGIWNGSSITLRLPKKALMRGDADAAVALVQTEGQGPILGAAELKLR